MICINNVLMAEISLEELITYCMDREEPKGLIHKKTWIIRTHLPAVSFSCTFSPT